MFCDFHQQVKPSVVANHNNMLNSTKYNLNEFFILYSKHKLHVTRLAHSRYL